jgi:hypothetical protein
MPFHVVICPAEYEQDGLVKPVIAPAADQEGVRDANLFARVSHGYMAK